jgi:hypothetical protein
MEADLAIFIGKMKDSVVGIAITELTVIKNAV